jgi:membrane-bound serine protease (ClpP class)
MVAADLFLPSNGLVTLIGLVLLVVSAMTMFDGAQAPGVAVALWAVLLVAGMIAAFAALGIYLALRTRKRPVATGQEGLVGRMAEVRKRLEPEGMVFVEGALWRAVSEDGEVETGEYVRITGVYELRLTVRRLADPSEKQA